MGKNNIHIDSDDQPSASMQLTGQRYANTVVDDHDVPLLCPNCNEAVENLAGGGDRYTVTVAESGGKSHQGSLPPCPLADMHTGLSLMTYSCDPCGCKVSPEWAGAFTAEKLARMSGQVPRSIMPMSTANKALKLARLENWLSRLYSLQAMAGDASTKKDVDYWILVVVDQIQRLCPGTYNKVSPKALDPAVLSWGKGLKIQWSEPAKATDWDEGEAYGKSYKTPPGYKGTGNAMTCTYMVGTVIHVNWSDGFQRTFVDSKEFIHYAKELASATVGMPSSTRQRAIALAKVQGEIVKTWLGRKKTNDQWLDDLTKLAQAGVTAKKEDVPTLNQPGPVPAPDDCPLAAPAPSLESTRYVKKRRTIRRIGDE